MMDPIQKAQKQLDPNEHWDQLAVSQISKVLAPHGYKKVQAGKREVAMMDFIDKARVQNVQVMAANMIRLYREILREDLTDQLKKAEENLAAAKDSLSKCAFHELGAKKSFETLIARKEIEIEVLKNTLGTLDQVKPRSPRSAQRPAPKPDDKGKIVITPEKPECRQSNLIVTP